MSARRKAIAALRAAPDEAPEPGPYDHLLNASKAELRALVGSPWSLYKQLPLVVRLRILALDDSDAP